MLISILILLLTILLCISLLINKGDVLSVVNIAICMFIISLFVCLLFSKQWQFDISPTTFFVIFFSIVFLSFGSLLGERIFSNRRSASWAPSTYKPKTGLTYFFIIIMAVTTLLFFRYIYQISIVAGNTSGYAEMFKYARYAVINVKYNVDEPTYLKHLLLISKALAFIYLFMIISNILNNATFKKNMYLVPIMYIVQISISTARIDFIRLLSYIFIISVILWKRKNGWRYSKDYKIILFGLGAIIIFFVAFRMLGMLTAKTVDRDLSEDISIYMGSSILALNEYLDRGKIPNDFFGKETLYNIYSILRTVGLTKIEKYNIPLEFVYFGDQRTNIYTALRRTIQDYGMFGSSVIMFIEGFFYGSWLQSIKKGISKNFSLILFACLFYPVIEIAIEERFISNIFTLATIYQAIYLFIFYSLLIKKSEVTNNG